MGLSFQRIPTLSHDIEDCQRFAGLTHYIEYYQPPTAAIDFAIVLPILFSAEPAIPSIIAARK